MSNEELFQKVGECYKAISNPDGSWNGHSVGTYARLEADSGVDDQDRGGASQDDVDDVDG